MVLHSCNYHLAKVVNIYLNIKQTKIIITTFRTIQNPFQQAACQTTKHKNFPKHHIYCCNNLGVCRGLEIPRAMGVRRNFFLGGDITFFQVADDAIPMDRVACRQCLRSTVTCGKTPTTQVASLSSPKKARPGHKKVKLQIQGWMLFCKLSGSSMQ